MSDCTLSAYVTQTSEYAARKGGLDFGAVVCLLSFPLTCVCVSRREIIGRVVTFFLGWGMYRLR